MTVIKRKITVPYTPAEMFALVDDIERYPEFLPWCRAAVVHSRTADTVHASISVAKGGVHQQFSTLNRLQQNKMIELRLVEGPFRHLHGFWRFDLDPNHEGGCIVQLDLEFEFSSKLISITVGPVLEKIAESFIDAFWARAKEIYGDRL